MESDAAFLFESADYVEDPPEHADPEPLEARRDLDAGVPAEVDAPDAGALTVDFPNFDPVTAGSDVIGDPAREMTHWHQQEAPNSCAVAAQEFILDGFAGFDRTETQLSTEAQAAGWYTPEGGTPMAHVGKLLEVHGMQVERHHDATLDSLGEELASGGKVIVGVDSSELLNPGAHEPVEEIADALGMSGQGANHAVEVIGIDPSTPDGPMVVLNDPGYPDGRGVMVPAGAFDQAWADSGRAMFVATGAEAPTPAPTWWGSNGGGLPSLGGYHNADGTYHWVSTGTDTGPDGEALGGYYNSDGTYHWTSDDTDRDPETGSVVRRW